jgi:hypothetical protein
MLSVAKACRMTSRGSCEGYWCVARSTLIVGIPRILEAILQGLGGGRLFALVFFVLFEYRH